MTTRNRSTVGSLLLGLVILVLPACQSSCATCARTGISLAAAVKTTHITAPPGGGSRQFLEVVGNHFNPNTPITVSFRQYPASDPNQVEFSRPNVVTTDAGGRFRWDPDLHTLPARNFNAERDVDVWITAKEATSACFGMTSVKTQQILSPPL
jgi:hypothetical protein